MEEEKTFARLIRFWSERFSAIRGTKETSDSPEETLDEVAGAEPDVGNLSPSELVAEVRRLARELAKKERHLKGLLHQRNELQHQLRAVEQAIASMELQLQEAQAESEAALAARTDAYEETVRSLTAERDAALNRLQAVESQLAGIQSAAQGSASEIAERVQALEAELAARSQALEEARRSREELNQRLTELERDYNRARASEQELEQARTEAARARALAAEAEEARRFAEERAATLESELADTQLALVEKVQREGAAAAPRTVSPPTVEESVDLTGEWEQVASAEAEPAEAQEPAIAAGVQEESSEAMTLEVLPVPEEAAAEPPTPEPVPGAPEREKKMVLVAEDDPAIRRLVELTLQKSGLEVVTAEDGEEAYQKALTERPDAVLTDIVMPRMNGMELVSKLKATPLTARIPVGFLTAQRELEYYKGALEMGSRFYVTKPFRPDNLVSLVNLLLAGQKKPRSSSH